MAIIKKKYPKSYIIEGYFKDYDIYCVNFTIPYVKLQFNIWHDHELDDKLILDLEKQGRIKLIFT